MKSDLKRMIAEYILGEREEITISGRPEDVAVTAEAIQASKSLYQLLQQSDSDSVGRGQRLLTGTSNFLI